MMLDGKSMLNGLRVVDLGAGMAPAIVAKFLADAGAQVRRLAPDGDDAFAAIYPAYEVWHAAAEPISPTASSLGEALAHADVCIVGGEDHPDVLRRHDHVPNEDDFPALVILRIAANPEDEGPGSELLAQARSGVVFEQFADRPMAMSFAPANMGAALQGLLGVMAALFEREVSRRGQTVLTSLVDGAQSWLPMFWMDMERPSPSAAFVVPKAAVPLVFRCRDGKHIHLVLGSAGSKYLLYRALGIDDPTVQPTDSGIPRPGGDPRNFYGDIDILTEYCAKLDRDALLAALWAEGLPVEPVLEPGQLWDDPQIARNRLIATDAAGRRSVGLPFLARRVAAAEPRAVPVGARPLEDIRIVDFGAYVAGPLASQLLTGLGADVVKVEPPRGDPSRGLLRGYLAANRGKRGVTLDLKRPEDLARARRLALDAHVVTSNFRPGVSARLGIDPPTLFEARPDLVMLESPAYGSEGPNARRAGFDMVMQAASGLEHRAGAAGGQPLWNRLAVVDFAAGTVGAIAILCGLYVRRRAGQGVWLEMPLLNAGLFLLSELVQLADGRFVGADPVNADATGYHPLDALYRAQDGWVAIHAVGRDGAARLRAALRLSDDAALHAGTIASAVAGHASADLLVRLRDAGIGIERCREGAERALLDDPHAAHRGAVRLVKHGKFGWMKDLGLFFTLSRSPLGNDLPIHDVGEHNAEILEAMAG